MLLEALDKAWNKQRSFTPLEPDLTFGPDGLTLGCGAVLAKAERALGRARINLEGQEARIEALLAAAYGRRVDEAAMRHLRRGVLRWNEGDAALAAMHLAFMGLGRLPNPRTDAKRLFMAEALLDAGASPDLIFETLGLTKSATATGVGHYNPAEPRVPKGSGPASGEWMQIFGLFLRGLTRKQALALAGVAARFSAPTVFLATLFIPTNKTSTEEDYSVPGHPGVRLHRGVGERLWRLTYPGPNGHSLTAIEADDGLIRDQNGKIIGHTVEGAVVFDGIAVGVADRDAPSLCPKYEPDRPGHEHMKSAIAYEDYIKSILNPKLQQTPSGFGVSLPNPGMRDGKVMFDDCQHRTGIMAEMKGPGYADKLPPSKNYGNMEYNIKEGFLKQAQDQVQAVGSPSIMWIFAEKSVADYMATRFSEHGNGLEKIAVVYEPYIGK